MSKELKVGLFVLASLPFFWPLSCTWQLQLTRRPHSATKLTSNMPVALIPDPQCDSEE